MSVRAGERLPRDFYARPTVEVAQALLGQRLVRILDGERLAGRIVEAEAYDGPSDPASHAYRGRTPRNAVMFGPPGFAYVYFIYGMHFCLNVVTEREGYPAAVLIRAVEPMEGLATMRRLRTHKGRTPPEKGLTAGPARLCQAMGIARAQNGVDLVTDDTLFIEADEPIAPEHIAATPRIGIVRDEWASRLPWRFVVKGSPYLSR